MAWPTPAVAVPMVGAAGGPAGTTSALIAESPAAFSFIDRAASAASAPAAIPHASPGPGGPWQVTPGLENFVGSFHAEQWKYAMMSVKLLNVGPMGGSDVHQLPVVHSGCSPGWPAPPGPSSAFARRGSHESAPLTQYA